MLKNDLIYYFLVSEDISFLKDNNKTEKALKDMILKIKNNKEKKEDFDILNISIDFNTSIKEKNKIDNSLLDELKKISNREENKLIDDKKFINVFINNFYNFPKSFDFIKNKINY